MSDPAELVLASTSRYRAELLRRLDVPFEIGTPDFDERAEGPPFEGTPDDRYALALAAGKARSIATGHRGPWILAADQIAVLPGPPRELLHKPQEESRAVDQLMHLAGKTHVLTTGVVLLDARTGEQHAEVDRQRLTMRAFERVEAAAYVARHRPLDCVGSYRIEDAGIRLFEHIEGDDITGVMGLPLLCVCRLLRRAALIP